MRVISSSAHDLRELEQALRRDAGSSMPPPGLHQAIMDSVHACREVPLPKGINPMASRDRDAAVAPSRISWDQLLRWVPAPALGLCVLLAFVTARPPIQVAESTAQFATATSILLSGADITDSATGSLMAPMAEEYKLLSEDLSRTAAFLVSCIP